MFSIAFSWLFKIFKAILLMQVRVYNYKEIYNLKVQHGCKQLILSIQHITTLLDVLSLRENIKILADRGGEKHFLVFFQHCTFYAKKSGHVIF